MDRRWRKFNYYIKWDFGGVFRGEESNGGYKWVYRKKETISKNVRERYKTRIVAKGYS